jgi:hypothetical protein
MRTSTGHGAVRSRSGTPPARVRIPWRRISTIDMPPSPAPGRAGRRDAVKVPLIVAVALAASVWGCSVSPARQQAIRDSWAARDAERAAECHQHNVGFAGGGCVAGGP